MQSNTAKKEDHRKYLEHILRNLPRKPGVYRMKDAEGTVIYVGKAKDLRNRVSSYFQSGRDKTTKTIKMVGQIADIDYSVVGSDLEAVMMETNLIKELRPKYNVLMKDDKNYVYIKITVNEDFPRIFVTRRVDKDKARYFGPKTAAHKVMKTLKVLKRIFPFRHCQLMIDYVMPPKDKPVKDIPGSREGKHTVKVTNATIKYPCIDYHIKRCIGPCIGTVSPEEYRKIIDQIIRFLEGKHEEVIQKLKEDMMKAAGEKKFEVAAAMRDKLSAIEDIMEKQRISTPDQRDLDVINYVVGDDKIFINLFQVRTGKLINQENFELRSRGESRLQHEDEEALISFLQQYYEKATDLPHEVLIPHEIEEKGTMEKWLGGMKGGRVKLNVPERGRKNELLELSLQNAKNFAKLSEVKWQGHEKGDRQNALQELQKLLGLEAPPRRLECYDVSHFGGTETVSSMVVFENGFPKKDDYRKFKLHQEEVGAPNDFASMEETLLRRLKYLKPSIAAGEVKITKAKKKELEKLREERRVKKLPPNTYYRIEKKGTFQGFVEVLETANKKFLIEKLPEFSEIQNIRTAIIKIAEKHKAKRIYVRIPGSEKAKYEEVGCQPITKIPDGFKKRTGTEIHVYDRNKYKEDSSFKKKPDLIIIDGGKGQLSSALKALERYKLRLPIISIAKKNEELFLPGKSQPILLLKDDPILHMIQHIRNEAHRFAITYHQGLQLQATKHSALDEIYGLGDQTKMKLLRHFGSPEGIRTATMYELEQIVGKKAAIKIKEKLG